MSARTGRALVALLAALASSCASSPSQLVVVVDTNFAVPTELDQIEVVVTGPSGIRTGTPQALAGPGAPALPLTLGVTPAGEALGPIEVTAIGTLGGVEVVRTGATVTLTAGETRTLTLYLVRNCAGRECGPGQTCGPGGCGSRARGDLPAWDGVPPPLVSSDPCDAMPWDVDGDGFGSAACGGSDCDDGDAARSPDAVEDCDGIDNDCDGAVDPGCDCTPNGLVEDCTTECGSTGSRTCAGGTFGPCELPAETCSGLDDDCDGRVDEGFAYAPIGETQITEDTANSRNARLISAAGRWTMVWQGVSAADGIMGATLNGNGSTFVAPGTLVPDGTRPDLTWSGTHLGLVHTRADRVSCGTDCTRTDHRVFATVIAPLTMTAAGPTRIADRVDGNPRLRVVWDGTLFRTSHLDGPLVVRSFDVDATDLGTTMITASNENHADMVFSGTRYAYAWANGDEVYVLTEDTLGTGIPQTVEVSRQTRHASLDVARAGYLVAWYYEEEGGLFDRRIGLDLTVVDETGAPSGTTENLSTSVGGEGFMAQYPDPPSVRRGGEQILVAWSDQRDLNEEIYLARVSLDGEVVQEASRITVADGESDGPSLAYDETSGSFALAWHDLRTGNAEIFFARLGCDG